MALRGLARAEELGSDTWRNGSALVLAGGGARGAYEAGVIEGLRQSLGLDDGNNMPFDLVCGASIGCVNGWFVATANYSGLRNAWATISSANLFRLKKKYAAVPDAQSGVLTRVAESLSLLQGVATNEPSVLDGEPIGTWIRKHVDPKSRLHSIFAFSATNLQNGVADVFYRLPGAPNEARRAAAERNIKNVLGEQTAVRVADDSILHAAMQSSTAIPVLFEPVDLPGADGTVQQYVDGGVAESAPITLARSVAKLVHTVFVDPVVDKPQMYAGAVEIGVASFEAAQRRVLESALRDALLEARGKELFGSGTLNDAQRAYMTKIFASEFYVIRPAADLPVDTAGFNNQAALDATYAIGVADGRKGWRPYLGDAVVGGTTA